MVHWVHKSGAKYDDFLQPNDTTYLERVASHNPDMVCVALAGNSVGSAQTVGQIKDRCQRFYRRLREFVPNAIIISTECEMRWYKPNNNWGGPLPVQYRAKMRTINTFMNRNVRVIDYIFQLGGTRNGMINRQFFDEDGCHLKEEHQDVYWTQLRHTVNYIHDDIDKRVRNQHLNLTINIAEVPKSSN